MKINPSAFLITLICILFMSAGQASAQSPDDFGREFSLFVHQQNQDLEVPRGKGVQVLESYFAGSPLKASYDDSNQFMSQREFLLAFEKHRLASEGKEVMLSDEVLYPMSWLRARRYGWLPNAMLTYGTMQDFLYRYSVSQKHGGLPYYEGLVLDEDEITADQYKSITQVKEIAKKLNEHKTELEKLSRPTQTQQSLLVALGSYENSFINLEKELEILEHPLNKIPNLPEDVRQKILDNDLNEVLDSITYNYSHNNANRIHNLVTGAQQMSGMVFQPDEIMDFTKILGNSGWNIYKMGWVIFGGEEVWQFGGGLCGSATITFTPSWRAGLEIVSRFPHSIYYRNLYPEGSLGLDATIYRGAKNLIMKNTTGSPLLYYVRNDHAKMEVTMYLIGNSPYQNIDIEGPIYAGRNTYKWVRRMTRFDGTVVEDELVTKYGAIH